MKMNPVLYQSLKNITQTQLKRIIRPDFAVEQGERGIAHPFPESGIRNALRKRIGLRALTLIGTLREERSSIIVQNSEEKNIAEGNIHNRMLNGPENRQYPLPSLLSLTPLKGFEEECGRLHRKLTEQYQTVSVETVFRMILTETGHIDRLRRIEYPPKLAPHWTVCHTVKAVAFHLLEELEIHRQGIIDDTDTEFLHNYRVAIRRFRAVIGQLKN